ncbi:MAG: DMT family transporter [Acidobacteriota bacterium]
MIGETAALLTSVCWSCSSVAFGKAGERAGSPTVNHVRLWLALLLLSVIHLLLLGTPFPFGARRTELFWMALSGLVGFAIGDSLLFESFVHIGARLSMLIMTLAPIMGALLGWVFLGETLSVLQIIAIGVTLAGIAVVVAETNEEQRSGTRYRLAGILMGVGGAAGQAGGLLLSKVGMAGGLSPFSANLIRLAAATLIIGAVAAMRRQAASDFRKMRDPRALAATSLGTLAGPVFGVVLSLYAVAHTHIGIASTLMSLAPIILLPVSHFALHERVTFRAVLGTLVSVAGVTLLFVAR